jgi:hypothetical protein
MLSLSTELAKSLFRHKISQTNLIKRHIFEVSEEYLANEQIGDSALRITTEARSNNTINVVFNHF